MNFAFDSVKPKSKVLNEDFYFEFETPRGHCFIVLDFISHDYANLNATLKGKLETIVGSFVSLPSFSAELFLGFIAKDINNFIHDLAAQGGGPELLCSAALCFLNENKFSYFLRGNTQITLVSEGKLRSLGGAAAKEEDSSALGKSEIEAPTSEVETLTVADSDTILIMTESVARTIRSTEICEDADAKSTCDLLLQGSAASNEDRTLIVINGPYQRQTGAALSQEFVDDLNRLKEEVQGKAGNIALLELGGKIDSLAATIAGKADNAELLELKRDVLRIGLSVKTNKGLEKSSVVSEAPPLAQPQSSSLLKTAVVALIVSLAAGFLGGWFFSRRIRPVPEVWSVKSSGNQISIARQNGATVTLDVAKPLKATGEQTFSSFADVQRYIDTISAPDSSSVPAKTEATELKPEPGAVTEVIVKPGDSLKRFAQHYNVPQERIMELNPTITRWPYIKAGQKILVPSSPIAAPSPTAAPPNSQSGG